MEANNVYDEIKTLRDKLQESIATLRHFQEWDLNRFRALLREIAFPDMSSLSEMQVEAIADALYCIVKPQDISGQTLVVRIPVEGKIPDDLLMRYCAYIDFLKGMGAKGAVFLHRDSSIEALSDRELERFGLRRIENANSENESIK